MAYVYRHIRLDKNQPFYIGIGLSECNYNRAYQKSKTKRSKYWHNIAKNGYCVEIIMSDITKNEAFEKEIEFIKLYGRADIGTGILCNLTNGGENPPIISGDRNSSKRKDVRDKISKKRLGVKLSEEHKINLSISAKNIGRVPPSRKGTKMSKESIAKMVKSRMNNGCKRKSIYQYDKLGNFIYKWDYAKDIKDNNPSYSIGNIQSVCRGERNFAYDCIWSYKVLAGLTKRREAEANLYFKQDDRS